MLGKHTLPALCGGLLLTVSFAAQAEVRPTPSMLSNTCAGCHGTYGTSVGSAPSINNMSTESFIRAMKEFRDGVRTATIMDRFAKGYTDQDFVDMANFFKDK